MKKQAFTAVTFAFLWGVANAGYSLTLSEAVVHTLKTNPEVLAAKREYYSRELEIKQARAGYLPQISLRAGIGEETRRSPATGNRNVDLERKELSLQAQQMLFDGMATSSEVRRQKSRATSAKHDLGATAEDLALRTSSTYLDVLRHAELLTLTRESLDEHQSIYDQMKLRSETGVGSSADLNQIGARLALAHANMIVAQNNLDDVKVNFFRLTGFRPNVDHMQKPDAEGTLPPSVDQAINRALENHPTLHSAQFDFKSAMAQHRASRSSFLPRIQLEAEKRWDENVGGIRGDDEDLIIALRLNYTLYSGGANRARKKQTAELVEQSKDVRNNVRRQVIESMNLSWNSYQALSSQMKYLQMHVDAASATKEAYSKQFSIGRRTLLDLLNTETEVIEAKRAFINAEYDKLYSRYRVFNASGALLSALSVDWSVEH
ncbi:MAG: hydroxyalkanoic acid synthase [Alteromonadaceae bacterium]|nr:MAG: hydroxyalkanoic acid synthase [Alteromonadaceae bacterium]